jgi:aspartate racemase
MNRANGLPKAGIIGGAGPMAGMLLFRKIIEICQNTYGCRQDADFPYIVLINYPFADMLATKNGLANRGQLMGQLKECLASFCEQGVAIAAIACNTLHECLDPGFAGSVNLIDMVLATAENLAQRQLGTSLVLCTGTSARYQLHRKAFSCMYPDEATQAGIDAVIDRILAGQYMQSDAEWLADRSVELLEGTGNRGIVLGCTELSWLRECFPYCFNELQNGVVVDPELIVAEKMCSKIFNNKT